MDARRSEEDERHTANMDQEPLLSPEMVEFEPIL